MKEYANLFEFCKDNQILVKRACEIGVFTLDSSTIRLFLADSEVNCLFFEANPSIFSTIYKDVKFVDFRAEIFNLAIGDRIGIERFYGENASVYHELVKNPPVVVNNKATYGKGGFYAYMTKFSEVDPKDIDLLSIDVEGGEFAVLKNILSRPKVINIEMYWKDYKNPHYEDIEEWMKQRGYTLAGIMGADSIYLKDENNA